MNDEGSGFDSLIVQIREFVVVYAYGMGGVSAMILAPSRSILESAHPDLVVFDERPGWMDQGEYGRIAERSGFPFDKPDNLLEAFLPAVVTTVRSAARLIEEQSPGAAARFCFVADGASSSALLLRLAAGLKQKAERSPPQPTMSPVIRGSSSAEFRLRLLHRADR